MRLGLTSRRKCYPRRRASPACEGRLIRADMNALPLQRCDRRYSDLFAGRRDMFLRPEIYFVNWRESRSASSSAIFTSERSRPAGSAVFEVAGHRIPN